MYKVGTGSVADELSLLIAGKTIKFDFSNNIAIGQGEYPINIAEHMKLTTRKAIPDDVKDLILVIQYETEKLPNKSES